MALQKITCQIPEGQIYYFEIEVQNIRSELSKRIHHIPYDNIILVDDQDKVYSASTALYSQKYNNLMKELSYTVIDAQQLYREYKELIKMKSKYYQELIETAKELSEIKEKEIQYKTIIQQLSEKNTSEEVNILITKLTEIDKIKAQKEVQIQDKYNYPESELDQRIIKSLNQEDIIIKLQEENIKQQIKIEELQIKSNQETNQNWQSQCQFLNTQLQQYLKQQKMAIQSYYDLVSYIDDLEFSIQELRVEFEYSKNNEEKYKSQLKLEKNKLDIANEKLSQFEIIVLEKEFQIKKYEREQKLLECNSSNEIQDDKDKITGLMEILMQSPHKIYEFEKQQNDQLNQADYEIFEINMDNDLANELLNKNQYVQFEQCLKANSKGDIKLSQSIQPNSESIFFKGYLSVVKQATQNEYIGNFFLIEELVSQNQPFKTIDEAIQLSKNNFFCQLLMEKFNKMLNSSKIKEGDYQIARQFVLKAKDKEVYYYCEMVNEGEFRKINSGIFQPKMNEIDSYFNEFSKYVYQFSNENYIITHLQICGKNVYDMIVSTTNKGSFSILDQGENEIRKFLQIIDNQPAQMIKTYWNDNIEAITKEEFK
ncbi:unnamed protein product [Paramecium pentaurelia]|uniref:Alpha-type protein kinase domain-containing protein n=1 Tax=Paramecium pentaurelia TaxID=43138 RepID=A0A8S1UWF5_9CILI|nr:unnamed protein product [Paramecium pentaurelia]